MLRLKIRDNYYKMIDDYSLENSAREVKFSDVKVDFSNTSIDDLPLQYEEIQIVEGTEDEINNNTADVIFFGYAESYKFSEMKNDEDDKELTISILSPMELATLRTVTLQGYYNLENLIKLVLAPLFDEGFILADCNVANGNVTVSFLMQTVEYCMNNLSNSNNLFWFINAKKEIYVYDISFLFEKNTVLEISDNQIPDGLVGISPELEAVNYANVFNVKNARIYFNSYSSSYPGLNKENSEYVLYESGKSIKKGDTIILNYPFDCSKETLEKIMFEDENPDANYEKTLYTFRIILSVNGEWKETKISLYKFFLNETDAVYTKDSNISFSDEDEEKKFVLQRDSFFYNLITSIKYNGEDAEIIDIRSDTALKYSSTKFFFSEEIEKSKGKINNTGIVETTVDMNQKWFTQQELASTIRNMITVNGSTCNIVTLTFDYSHNLRLGDILNINKPNFFVQGKFVVSDISEKYENDLAQQYEYEVRNASVLDNFIDIFRTTATQESEDTIESVTICEYTESVLQETHYLSEKAETEDEKALRLAKEAWLNEWGNLDGFSFRVETMITDNDYVISVRDAATTATFAWIYVNIITEKVEIEL